MRITFNCKIRIFMSTDSSKKDIVLQVECWFDSSHDPAKISIGALAQDLDIPVRTLRRRLAAQQTTFTELFMTWRFVKAKQLLRQSDTAIQSVAQRLGYTHTSNFERAFKRWTGHSPGAYRKRRIGVAGSK